MFLARNFWLVKFTGFALCAAFAGSAASTYIGSKVVMGAGVVFDEIAEASEGEGQDGNAEGEESDDTAPEQSLAAAGVADKAQTAQAIREANIFCPNCRPEQPQGPVAGPQLAPSKLALRVVAITESEDALLTMVTLEDRMGNVGGYGLEDELAAGIRIVGIDRGGIEVDNRGRRERLDLSGTKLPPPEVEPEKTKGKPKKKETRVSDDPRIKCANEASCTIERSLINEVMSKPSDLMASAMMRPVNSPSGDMLGFRFTRLKSGSLVRQLGLQRGDILTSVDGQRLDSMDTVMALTKKLRNARHIELQFERKGKVQTKSIEIS